MALIESFNVMSNITKNKKNGHEIPNSDALSSATVILRIKCLQMYFFTRI